MGVLFAISYAILVALAKNLLKLSLKEFPPSVSFFLETLFGISIWIPFAILSGVNINNVINIFPVVFISAILSEAYIFYIYSKGQLSVIVPVFSTYSIFTVLFAHMLLSERLEMLMYLLISMCITGVLLLSLPSQRDINKNKEILTTILWGLSGAIAVGFSDTISTNSIHNTSAPEFLFCLAIAQIPVSLGYLKLEKQSPLLLTRIKVDFNKYKLSLAAGLLFALGQLCFWMAFENNKASIASPITSSQVMFTAVLAYIILGERLSTKDKVAICIIALSILIISIFN